MITSPLRSGPDIDWRSKCHPGDYQGEADACSVFSISNWAECMLNTPIKDSDAIDIWRDERQFRYGNTAGGLQIILPGALLTLSDTTQAQINAILEVEK